MRGVRCRVVLATFLLLTALFSLPLAALAHEAPRPELPSPPSLHPNVEFWTQIYSLFGIGDFVLHDRNNLSMIYDVVHVEGATNEVRAAEAARPEIQRRRELYARVLNSLADGVPPDDLGFEGRWISQAWGCPCPPEVLRRAATNIRVQQGLREKVEEGIQRARKWLPRIVSILRSHQVPEELVVLPIVESSFNPKAKSKAGAVGLWQFIKSTAKHYLTITRRRDDRTDPIRATEAAAKLLRHNYEVLGSWPLAITAYNHGCEGMLAARAAVGSDSIEEIVEHYTGPHFGFASRNFYAEFLAAVEVARPFLLSDTRR
jgi:membrane-bound lytic murein transglycosylase D